MKNKFKTIAIFMLILLLVSCTGNTEKTQSPIIETKLPEVNDAYPIQSESSYPGPQSIPSQSTLVIPENVHLVPTATPDPQKDVVIISNVDHSETGLETINITNISDQVQDINGYSLFIPSTNEQINIFNVTLNPGESYFVYNGSGANEQTDGIAWLDIPILQQQGDEVLLLNRPGRVIWTYIYYP